MKRSILGSVLGLWLAVVSAQVPEVCKCTSKGAEERVQECLANGTGCSTEVTVNMSNDTCETQLPYCVLCVRRGGGSEQTVTWTLSGGKAYFQSTKGIDIKGLPNRKSDFAGPVREDDAHYRWTATNYNSPGPRAHGALVFPKLGAGGGTAICTAREARIVNTDQ